MLDFVAVREALEEARQTGRFVSVAGYSAAKETHVNEYCLFIKPELTGLGDNFALVYDTVMERLSAFEQVPVAVSAIDASYIVRHDVMSQHYGVIDAISKQGEAAMSEAAVRKLYDEFRDELAAGMQVLGAHQFLERFPYFSAKALAVFYDNLSNIKLAGGTHCVRTVVRGQQVLTFNGFHPEQLERYTEPGAALLAFVIRTAESWPVLRSHMTGSTNPAKAERGSIRATLLEKKDTLGLDEVSSGKNGVHVSAGPVEGMVEIIRFMENKDVPDRLLPKDTTFGRFLMESEAASDRQLDYLATNPDLPNQGVMVPTFDLTEELDAGDAARRLHEAGAFA